LIIILKYKECIRAVDVQGTEGKGFDK